MLDVRDRFLQVVNRNRNEATRIVATAMSACVRSPAHRALAFGPRDRSLREHPRVTAGA